MINNLNSEKWIELYIHWELSLIKELGYEVSLTNKDNDKLIKNNFVEINNKSLKIPKVLLKKNLRSYYNEEIREALTFNKVLLLENFINPNRLRFPLFRNILESYYK